MSKKLFFLCSLIIFFQSLAFASVSKIENSALDVWSTPGNIYLSLSAGESYSEQASISVSSGFWFPSPEGYNSNVGQSEILGAGIGYIIKPFLRFDLGADHRNSFNYKKHQSDPNSTYGPRTRYFDLSNTTVMASLFVDGSGISKSTFYQGKNFIIDPFVGVGAGMAFNDIGNLYSVQTEGVKAISMIPANNTTRSFAYQLVLGVDVKTSRKFAIGINYRYLNAGHFNSNNYTVDNTISVAETNGLVVPPWRGLLQANEVFVSLKYAIG